MPDRMLLLKALATTAAAAAAVLLLCGWPWRAPGARRRGVGWAVGVGGAFYLGARLLGTAPKWPPREDQDRFLLLLLPAVVAVEAVAAAARRWWLAWPLRLAVAAGAARLLLHETTYLADLAGPGTSEWTTAQTWQILGGLAAALAVTWAALTPLARGPRARSVPAALAVAAAGAGATVMMSGYLTGGLLGLPLAAALAGAAVASLLLTGTEDARGALGVGLIGLFAVVVAGRFFGTLTTRHAALLLVAPLLCWPPELPFVRRAWPWLRGALAVVLVAVPVGVAVTEARERFTAASRPTDPKQPTLEDYENYRP
jgi:hypothetical protein